ncbi:MAG: sulfatase [Candidatus Sigynarchaeota archaeon]
MDPKLNLVFFALDTTRRDHVSCYGYEKKTTPCIDERIARHGTLFEQCFSVSNCTLPGYTSLFTGLYPTSHDIVAHGNKWPVRQGVVMLAELLKKAGYFNAQVTTLADFPQKFCSHLNRAFDRHAFKELDGKYKTSVASFEQLQGGHVVPAPRISAQATDLLDEIVKSGKSRPFFLFVHFWDPHTPYVPPDPFCKFYPAGRDPRDPQNHALDQLYGCNIGGWLKDWARKLDSRYKDVTDPNYVVSLYDGGIAYADHHVGVVLDKLDELGLTDQTAVVLTSDHGETMAETNNLICGQRAMFSHVGLTDPNCSIPFIIKAPGIAGGKRIEGFTSQVDMVPTLLDLLRVDYRPPYAFDGVSLLPNILGERDGIPPSACELGTAPADPTKNPSGAERKAVLVIESTYQKQRAIRTSRWKYIKKIDGYTSMPAEQLYDLMFDPGEARNIADEAPNITKPLNDAMEAWIGALCKKHGTTDPQPRLPLTLREGFTHQIRQMYDRFDKDQVFF